MTATVCPVEVHERMKRDSDLWALLAPLGRVRLDPEGPVIELRNCNCGSTLAKEIRHAK